MTSNIFTSKYAHRMQKLSNYQEVKLKFLTEIMHDHICVVITDQVGHIIYLNLMIS